MLTQIMRKIFREVMFYAHLLSLTYGQTLRFFYSKLPAHLSFKWVVYY